MRAGHPALQAEARRVIGHLFDVARQRVDGLVATMNAASGMAKADATTAVVSEMATKRKTMRDGMMKMAAEMIAHMMEHMEAGKDSMAMCPMMKQRGGMQH